MGLAGAEQAKLVRAGKDGAPITDGMFPEFKEFLAGYWIVEVPSSERAYAIAAEASTARAPGVGGAPLNMPIEARQVMAFCPEDWVCRGLASRVGLGFTVLRPQRPRARQNVHIYC